MPQTNIKNVTTIIYFRDQNCSQRETSDVRRGVQSVFADELHGVLRRHRERPLRGAAAEDVRALWIHSGGQDIQGQGVRLH